MEKNNRDYYTIDVAHIAKTILRRIWIVILAGLLAASVGLVLSAVIIEPEYSSTIKLYVNNISASGNSNISSSQIDAAQKLVNTYREVLHSKPTYEQILEKSEVPYNTEQLSKMIVSGSSNMTEVMYVTVTTHDPYEAATIANCIAEVLPLRISQVIDGASVQIVENATPNLNKVSPSITQYTVIGLLLGIVISVAALVVVALMDNKIHDEEYVIQTYDCPILAKIPSLTEKNHSGRYGYYKSRSKNTKA